MLCCSSVAALLQLRHSANRIKNRITTPRLSFGYAFQQYACETFGDLIIGHEDWVCNVREEACSKSGGKTPAPSSIKKNICHDLNENEHALRAQFIHNSISIFKVYQKVRELAALSLTFLVNFLSLRTSTCLTVRACPPYHRLYLHTIFKQLASSTNFAARLFCQLFCHAVEGTRMPRDYLCRCGGLCIVC